MMVMMDGSKLAPVANGADAYQVPLLGSSPWPGGPAALDLVFEQDRGAKEFRLTLGP
jgi:hypothetical protein